MSGILLHSLIDYEPLSGEPGWDEPVSSALAMLDPGPGCQQGALQPLCSFSFVITAQRESAMLILCDATQTTEYLMLAMDPRKVGRWADTMGSYGS